MKTLFVACLLLALAPTTMWTQASALGAPGTPSAAAPPVATPGPANTGPPQPDPSAGWVKVPIHQRQPTAGVVQTRMEEPAGGAGAPRDRPGPGQPVRATAPTQLPPAEGPGTPALPAVAGSGPASPASPAAPAGPVPPPAPTSPVVPATAPPSPIAGQPTLVPGQPAVAFATMQQAAQAGVRPLEEPPRGPAPESAPSAPDAQPTASPWGFVSTWAQGLFASGLGLYAVAALAVLGGLALLRGQKDAARP
jgi:hypothetical protein